MIEIIGSKQSFRIRSKYWGTKIEYKWNKSNKNKRKEIFFKNKINILRYNNRIKVK